jgi:hypothetical protein
MSQTSSIRIESLSTNRVAEAAVVVAKAITREPMTKVLGLTDAQVYADLVNVVEKLAPDNMSLVAIDESSDEIVGVVVNKDYTVAPVNPDIEIGDSLPIFTLLGTLNSLPAEASNANPGEVFHLFIMAIDGDKANQSVGSQLSEQVLKTAKTMGYRKLATETTGPISQHIARNKFGAREVACIKYADFEFNGHKIFKDVTEVDGCYMFMLDIV